MLCIHQIFRPKFRHKEQEGVGDCTICVPSEDNIYCKGFTPIDLVIVEVKDESMVLQEEAQ